MSNQDVQLLGRLAVHFKLITPHQASVALKAQGLPGEHRKFGELLVALRFITPEQLKWLLDSQERYLAKQRAEGTAAGSPVASTPAPSGPAQPAAPVSPHPSQNVVPHLAPGGPPTLASATSKSAPPSAASATASKTAAPPATAAATALLPPTETAAGNPNAKTAPSGASAGGASPGGKKATGAGATGAGATGAGATGAGATRAGATSGRYGAGAANAEAARVSVPVTPVSAARIVISEAPVPVAGQTPAPSQPTPVEPASQSVPEARPVVLTPPPPKSPEQRAMHDALVRAVQMGASDLHLHAGAPPQLRLGGSLKNDGAEKLSREETEKLLLSILTPEQQAYLAQHREIDFAYALPGVGRFRANVYRQQRGMDGVFRPISAEPPTLEQLGLPSMLAKLTSYHQGLVLLTGPAGCGKSSTLAALVNLINEDRDDHIITVEDPIEFIHKSRHCVVNQRQAVKHTATFASALRAALREDPDVIIIGELRDLETISLAISAAETGHLVLGTLHTNSTVRTINRILDAFPPKQQPQIRAMVSESLRAVISQRLVPTVDGTRRVPALEVLFVKPAISNLIRDQKTFQIRSILQTARSEGMCLLDDSLLELVKAGTISKETARKHAEDLKRFA